MPSRIDDLLERITQLEHEVEIELNRGATHITASSRQWRRNG